MATSLELQPGSIIVDKYRVVRRLGEGGMGAVYLVQHVKTDERFAMKILHPDVVSNDAARERFRREARTPARIDSDHVARVVDSDIAQDFGDVPFLVMEYLRGQNLQDLSDELGPLDPREVLVYLRQVAIALDKAHAIGIVHRDLKPENLFLTTRDDGSPCVKVLDFGIAKLSGATGDLVRIKATSTGDVFGTPLFMSPEQCKSESDKVGAQTDIWALGLIAYRLLSGDDFWTANTLTHLIAQIAYEPIPKPSSRHPLEPAFDAWFAICCARESSERFTSASEAIEALAGALGLAAESTAQLSIHLVAAELARSANTSQEGLAAPRPSGAPLKQTSSALTRDQIDASELPRRRRNGMIAAMAFAMVLAGGAVAWLVGAGQPSPEVGAAVDGGSAAVAPTPSITAEVTANERSPDVEPSAEPATEASASASVTASAIATPTPPPFRPPQVRPPPKPPVDPLSGRH
jgi:serine/threonine-protein kinase